MAAGRIALWLVAGVVLLFLALPTVIVVPVSLSDSEFLQFPPETLSLRWYGEFLTDTKWLRSTWLSVRTGLAVVVVSTVVGTAAALAIVPKTGLEISVTRRATVCVRPVRRLRAVRSMR